MYFMLVVKIIAIKPKIFLLIRHIFSKKSFIAMFILHKK